MLNLLRAAIRHVLAPEPLAARSLYSRCLCLIALMITVNILPEYQG